MNAKDRSLLDHPRFWTMGIGAFAIAYLLLIALLGQLRTEHYFILGVFIPLCYIPKVRPAMKLLLPFFLFGFLYDSLRFITPVIHSVVPVHVAQPYHLERALFGIRLAGGGTITPTEFFQTHTHVVMDLIAAFAYTCYVLVPFTLAFVLLAKNRPALYRFGWAFLGLNFLGFVTYYIYPAAPPWYVELHGLGPAIIDTPPHPARLMAVDALLGIRYFQTIYGRSANVFAALPSLHVAYPMLAWLYSKKVFRHAHWFFFVFWITVCCSAIYLRHHYVIDVLLGIAYAALTYVMVERHWKRRAARSTAVNTMEGAGELGPAA